MATDAYSRLYQAVAHAGAEAARTGALHIRLGTVLTASPLRVDVAGTDQEAARFYVAARLLKGYAETVDVSGGKGSFSANGYTHSVTLDDGTLRITQTQAALAAPALKAGDLVLLLTEDDQTFYLIDKVVRPT